MSDQISEGSSLYKLGIWIAEPGNEEFYSPGEIFIKAKEDQVFKVPKSLGEGDIPDKENLLELINVVSKAMIETLDCEKIYCVSLGESKDPKDSLHFRLLPRYREDKEILNEFNAVVGEKNDGLALMAIWRKQFLHKRKSRDSNPKPFDELYKKHKDAVDKIRDELHNLP